MDLYNADNFMDRLPSFFLILVIFIDSNRDPPPFCRCFDGNLGVLFPGLCIPARGGGKRAPRWASQVCPPGSPKGFSPQLLAALAEGTAVCPLLATSAKAVAPFLGSRIQQLVMQAWSRGLSPSRRTTLQGHFRFRAPHGVG